MTTGIGKYLYAVTKNSAVIEYGFKGMDGLPVYAIADGEIAAVVSNIPNKKIRPERRYLAAHQEVLKQLMRQATILPMAFGIISNSTESIKKILAMNREAFENALERVSGKVEMGLRITWDVPNIFDYFIHIHPELLTARDRFFSPKHAATQGDKLELGQMFERFLKEDRETHTEKVEKILSAVCSEIKRNDLHGEQEVMKLACLIDRDKQSAFEEGVFTAAKLFDDNFLFDYNGPWAPHNFVDVDLKV